jgi:hypothetical protein
MGEAVMMRLQTLGGCLRRLARVSVVGACLGVPLTVAFCGTPTALAQQGAMAQQGVESGIQRTYVNIPSVRLPIEIENAQRAKLQGLVLYMKDSPQGAWTKIDQGPAQQTEFIVQAPHQGEYWFRIVAIDVQGRSHPADLNKDLQDAVVVVVDLLPPSIDIRFAGVTNEGTLVQCEVRDANPDPLQTHFFYQTQNQVWQPLDPVPGRNGLYCIPQQAVLTNLIKVTAFDLAHNTTTRTCNLGELAQAAGQGPAPGRQLPVIPPVMGPGSIAPPPNPGAMAQSPYAPPAPSQIQTPFVTPPAPPAPPTRQTGGSVTIVQATAPGEEVRPQHETNTARPRPPVGGVAEPAGTSTMHPAATSDPAPSTTAGTLSRQSTTPSQIVGNPTVFLNYEIENQGASGVGKIEIWATGDQCRTWTKMVDDPSHKNPAELRFPGEGLFGVKLVAANGRGYGAEPPQSGDPADCWIEVDMTKPRAEIVAVQAGTGPDAGILTVFWKAEDKNLASDGIDLLFSATSDGPWTTIAKGVHNDKGIEGQYRWTPPSQAGAQSFLRLVVRDKAGNTAISQTVQPIPLDDLSRPRVHVLNVSTAPQNAPVVPATLSVPTALRPGVMRPVQATSVLESPTPPPSMPNLSGVESR